MRIVVVAAGAAGMYCGSCLRDNALAKALSRRGEQVTLVPLYTPLRLDEPAAAAERVFFGGVQVYLEEKQVTFPRLKWLRRVLGAQWLLRRLSRLSIDTAPGGLGPLTVSMLRGEHGRQRESLAELIAWMGTQPKPDVIYLSNALLLGLARELKAALRAPIVCALSGEDLFLDGLPAPYQNEALRLIGERRAEVDAFIASSAYYRNRIVDRLAVPLEQVHVVLPGLTLQEWSSSEGEAGAAHGGMEGDGIDQYPRERAGRTIGFFARFFPEKGLHLLAEAFARLARSPELADVRLRAAGYMGGRESVNYTRRIRQQLAITGAAERVELLGTLERDEKVEFFRGLDVFAMPTVYPESKGLPVMEAMLSGVPVVVPDHGSFPELVAATGGGVLHAPGDAGDLEVKLAELLHDEKRRLDLARRAKAGAREKFSADRMAAETLDVFERVRRRPQSMNDSPVAEHGGV